MNNKRLHNIWSCMRQRCNNTNNTAAFWYHDKGVRVCEEWGIYENFEKWALENGYADNLTIDREDSDGNYEPSNCRWITIEENRRLSRENRKLKVKSNKNAEIKNKRGRFMVVKYSFPFSIYDRVEVIKTGLTKTEAVRVAKQLKLNEPCRQIDFCARVADGHKDGERVVWSDLRRFATK